MKRKKTKAHQPDTKRRKRIRRSIRLLLSPEQQLLEAVRNQKLGHLERLIARGADVNTRDDYHYTPLALAAWSGQSAALQVLLQAGAAAGINQRDREEGVTALHAAVIVCRDLESAATDNVFHLLAAGADANLPDRDGWTPLHSCAFYHLPQFIPALLAAGADPTQRDRQGLTPTDRAQKQGFTDIVQLLDHHAPHNSTPQLSQKR